MESQERIERHTSPTAGKKSDPKPQTVHNLFRIMREIVATAMKWLWGVQFFPQSFNDRLTTTES